MNNTRSVSTADRLHLLAVVSVVCLSHVIIESILYKEHAWLVDILEKYQNQWIH